jgi:hypothetical protein
MSLPDLTVNGLAGNVGRSVGLFMVAGFHELASIVSQFKGVAG